MKRSHSPTSSSGAARVRRRTLLGTAVLVVLLAVAGLVGYVARPDTSTTAASPAASPSASANPDRSGASTSSPTASNTALLPPTTRDPLAFAKAAAVALWSYDTRVRSQSEQLSLLHRWLSKESDVVDTDSVDDQVPSPTLWGRMADSGQYATATATDARFPDSFSAALREDPDALTSAYVYAVTVSGKQSIAWKGSPGGGAESRTTTLAVQCRPRHACALVGVLPAVAS